MSESPLLKALKKLLSVIPASSQISGGDAPSRSKELISAAALKAAALSGTLSLPPGPAGLLTILPDLFLIWKIQRQLVADLAASYGQTVYLTRESMLYCLFKHGASQALRDIMVRAGERVLIRRATQSTLEKVGVRVGQRMASNAMARWLPIVGAVGVGAYAYYDTAQVGRTAMALFTEELGLEEL
ncbi:MAG TPA: EcsC family protein [Planctomycetota bacterium]